MPELSSIERRDLTKEERKALIAEAEEERRQNATLTITAALRAKRFKKLLNNSSLTGNDPSLTVALSNPLPPRSGAAFSLGVVRAASATLRGEATRGSRRAQPGRQGGKCVCLVPKGDPTSGTCPAYWALLRQPRAVRLEAAQQNASQ